VHHLASRVGRLDRDERIGRAATRVEQDRRAFCDLRDVLRTTNAELPRAEERTEHQHPLAVAEHQRLQEIRTAAERVLCGSLDNLADAFADLGSLPRRDAAPLVRDHRDSVLDAHVRALLRAARQPEPAPSPVDVRSNASAATVV
jgi:hypothetical protein